MRFFDAARGESFKSDFTVRVGAVCVYKGKVVSYGHSSEKTSPVQQRFNAYRHFDNTPEQIPKAKIHAEISALHKLRNTDIDFSKLSVYVWRQYSNGQPAMSRPCEGCIAYMHELGVRHIYYSTSAGLVYEKLFSFTG